MKPGDLLADYEIVEIVAVDGTARAYRARPPERLGLSGDSVTVKVLPGGDEQAFRRFSRELKLYARVTHAGLLHVYDAGQHEDLFFYTTEWCDGGALHEAPTADRGVRLAALARTARAVHELHEAGIVHRDIRPANILLRADGSAVLADLGVAHAATATMTSMAPMASVGYVDPRLLLGEPASRATDVYALGATMHQVLTGRHLYPRIDGADMLMAIRSVLSDQPRIAREDLSPEETDLIAASIDRRIEARPPTAELFAHLVEEILGEVS